MGFDGVEILHVQMEDESNAALQKIKRQAHSLGLALMGFSTHQGFVTPDRQERQTNIQKTLYQIDVAYRLGIPTMRINTGRWGTTRSFDELMAQKGIEPPLPGHTDEEAFKWVIEALEKLLPRAEECGVVLGLENHWGLGRTAEGVLRIVEAIKSPWLQITLDTGNFLEDSYEQMERMASSKVPLALVQAKTYFGGGRWYALDLDYARIADDPAQAQLPRLDLAGVRGERGRRDRGAQEPGAAEETLRMTRHGWSASELARSASRRNSAMACFHSSTRGSSRSMPAKGWPGCPAAGISSVTISAPRRPLLDEERRSRTRRHRSPLRRPARHGSPRMPCNLQPGSGSTSTESCIHRSPLGRIASGRRIAGRSSPTRA